MTNPIAPIASAVERLTYQFHADDCGDRTGCGKFPKHRADAIAHLGITSTRVADWPVIIVGAPLRCGRCREPIHHQGTTPLAEVESALRDHLAVCDALTEEGVIRAPNP